MSINKKLLLALILGMFLLAMPLISAEKLTYSNDDLNVTLHNTIIFGLIKVGEIGEFQLKSHPSVNYVKLVGAGNQVVMWYDFNFEELYSNGLGDVTFIDMNTNKKIERDYNYVYWGTETRQRDTYTKKCSTLINGSKSCESIIDGTEDYEYTGWLPYNSKDIPQGNIRIGIQVEVKVKDYVDGIWEVGGKQVTKHASWTADLNTDILSYYKLDDDGSPVVDSTGNNDGTNNGAGTGVTGIINTAYNFSAVENDYVQLDDGSGTISTITTGNMSINMWINQVSRSAEQIIITGQAGGFKFSIDSTGHLIFTKFGAGANTATDAVGLGAWHMITAVYDADANKIGFFTNGTQDSGGLINYDASGFTAGVVYQMAQVVGGANEFNGLIDEVGIWNRSLTNEEVTQLWNSGAGISFIELSSSLDSPVNDSTLLTTSTYLNSTYSTDGNLVNSTVSVWYSNGTLHSDNVVEISGTANFTNVSLTNLKILGEYIWGVRPCLDTGYCSSSLTNNTFYVRATQNEIGYDSEIYETEIGTYWINITSLSGITPTSPKLNYNGTNYTATSTPLGNDDYNISYALGLNKTGNIDFYFTWELSGNTQQSNTTTQKVSGIQFTQCNATYATKFLNITFRDEGNSTGINASIPTSSFDYYLGTDTTLNKTYTFINVSENKYYHFCAFPVNKTFNVVPSVQYKSDGYPQRIWQPTTQTFTNSTTNQTLYLLGSADGIYVTFQVVNLADQTVSGVDVVATRTIDSSTVEIGHGTTDAAGAVTFWLNPDFTHTFTFTKSGYTTYTTSFAPTQTSYTISLSGGTTATSNYYRGIEYYTLPTNTSLTNDTIYQFGFNLTSSYWSLDSYGFNLRLNNGTIITGGSTSTSGTLLTLNYNTTNQSRIYLDYYWVINSTYTNGTRVWNVYSTDKTQWSISTFFTDLRNFLDSGFFGIDDFGRYLIIFIIIFLTIGIMSYKYGFTSPLVITTMIFLITFFFDVVIGIIPDIRIMSGVQVPHLLTFLTAIIMIFTYIKEFTK